MVEVSHGDGLSTRYAHNQRNVVEVGDLVRRGDVIALMGSSGRSTGRTFTSKSSNTAARSTRPLMCAARIADK